MSVWIVAAEFFTTEQVCKILSTARDRIKMEDWTAVCWSNKNGCSLLFEPSIIQYINILGKNSAWDVEVSLESVIL